MEFKAVTMDFPSGETSEEWLASYIKDLYAALMFDKKEHEDSSCWNLLTGLTETYGEAVGKESWEVCDALLPGWEHK